MSSSALTESSVIALPSLTVVGELSLKSYTQGITKKAAQRIGKLFWRLKLRTRTFQAQNILSLQINYLLVVGKLPQYGLEP